MSTNPVYKLVPGPTSVSKEIADIYSIDFGSPDLEDEFVEQYKRATEGVCDLIDCYDPSGVVLLCGEGMVALWGALKSVLLPGDKVLAIANGLFGEGIGDMAKQIGANVHYVEFEWDEAAVDYQRIKTEIEKFKPKLVTLVHCETPCAVLNPAKEIGKIVSEAGALFYVDAVSSIGGVPISIKEWNIDLALTASHKCLSLPPDIAIVTVSPRAWKVIDEVSYVGYDALKPWRKVVEEKYFPYTHNWRAVAALEKGLNNLKKEGYDNVYKRHEEVAKYCRQRIVSMGLKLFNKDDKNISPTVTAIYVPENISWDELNCALRKRGVYLAGNYGKLKGKVFRIGHMGSQADLHLVKEACNILESYLKENQTK